MGHLLGAPSRAASPRVHRVNAEALLGNTAWVEVDSIELHRPDPERVVAFAIDQPRAGDRLRGSGLEVNGWAIGHHVPVHAVRTLDAGRQGALHSLDVRRPDVAADYPDHPHAGSGFSAWVSIEPTERDWQITIEAILTNGNAVTLAQFQGRTSVERRVSTRGARSITAPDFVIIGTQRGGTSSLHAYLSAHPCVETPSTKELHFITDRYERGLDWYLGQFPGELPPDVITGEATPYALFHPLAPHRLRGIAPETKLIALLRNPVDRAYSHYLLERSRGDEILDFAAALDAESRRLDGEHARLSRDPSYASESYKRFSYLARGDYARQLKRWFEVFPREQILIVRSEDLFERSSETLARAAEFLGISPDVRIPFAAHNQTSGPPLDPAIRHRLSQHFAPLNAGLTKLLGWDPAWT